MTSNKPNWLITVASWEDRFRLGTERLLAEHDIEHVVMFYYEESDIWSASNRTAVKEMFAKGGIMPREVPISFKDPVATWLALKSEVESTTPERLVPLVDFTTMPRDTLWGVLSLLHQYGHDVNYAYHRPENYASWLSRDPGRPRLVYTLSGLATLGNPTCLIVATGFDPERTRQLMWHYEPRHVKLGFQSGDQYENNEKNVDNHKRSLKDEYKEFDVEQFELDAYSKDQGLGVLSQLVGKWKGGCNVVMTSLGPKLGAIAMYEVHRRFQETSLVYTPASEFNREYSHGLLGTHQGVVKR